MAVYTKLSKKEIAKHLEKYNIGALVDYKEILAGIDNSNFIIDTEKGRFILTIFESRLAKEDLPFFIKLKDHLSKKGICCPEPVASNDGESIVDLKGKKSAIVTFLSGKILQFREDGYYDNITAKHCYEVGKVMAKMQVGALDFKGKRRNDMSVADFRGYFAKFSDFLQDKSLQDAFEMDKDVVYDEMLKAIDFLEKGWQGDLPKGVSHLDLFPDNVFFNDLQEVSGVIDFYFAGEDIFVYDLAIIVNAWCFDESNQFVQERYDAMLKGYEEIRKLTKKEKDFLLIALVAGSVRFLLTRLHDMFHTPKDSLVKLKDPREYLEKLRFFSSKI